MRVAMHIGVPVVAGRPPPPALRAAHAAGRGSAKRGAGGSAVRLHSRLCSNVLLRRRRAVGAHPFRARGALHVRSVLGGATAGASVAAGAGAGGALPAVLQNIVTFIVDPFITFMKLLIRSMFQTSPTITVGSILLLAGLAMLEMRRMRRIQRRQQKAVREQEKALEKAARDAAKKKTDPKPIATKERDLQAGGDVVVVDPPSQREEEWWSSSSPADKESPATETVAGEGTRVVRKGDSTPASKPSGSGEATKAAEAPGAQLTEKEKQREAEMVNSVITNGPAGDRLIYLAILTAGAIIFTQYLLASTALNPA